MINASDARKRSIYAEPKFSKELMDYFNLQVTNAADRGLYHCSVRSDQADVLYSKSNDELPVYMDAIVNWLLSIGYHASYELLCCTFNHRPVFQININWNIVPQ